MSATVMVNGRTVVHAGSSGQAIAAGPDTCKTPAAPSPVPMPYPNIAQSSTTSGGSTTVRCDGQPIMLKDSEFSTSSGDEAGSAGGGVVSNVIKGKAKFTAYSTDVKADGKEVPRLGDPMSMNGNGANVATPAEVQATLTPSEAAAFAKLCAAFCAYVNDPTKAPHRSSDLEAACAANTATFPPSRFGFARQPGNRFVSTTGRTTIPDCVLMRGNRVMRCFDFKLPGDRWRGSGNGSQWHRQKRIAGGKNPVEVSKGACGC